MLYLFEIYIMMQPISQTIHHTITG